MLIRCYFDILSDKIPVGVLLDIDRRFVFLLECNITLKMIKNSMWGMVKIPGGNFEKIVPGILQGLKKLKRMQTDSIE